MTRIIMVSAWKASLQGGMWWTMETDLVLGSRLWAVWRNGLVISILYGIVVLVRHIVVTTMLVAAMTILV